MNRGAGLYVGETFDVGDLFFATFRMDNGLCAIIFSGYGGFDTCDLLQYQPTLDIGVFFYVLGGICLLWLLVCPFLLEAGSIKTSEPEAS